MNPFFTMRICALMTFVATLTNAQLNLPSGIHGNFQTDAQYYYVDTAIGAPVVAEKLLNNGFANINYINGNFSCGLRYESYLNVLQGFNPRFKGNGIMYRYANYTTDDLEVTLGSFYEQFGNGLVLRAYEERGLGYDNALDGLRLKYKIATGVTAKAFIGKQRAYFDYGPGIVRGADGEVDFNEIFPKLNDKQLQFTIGGSFVSKFQKDADPVYKLPENVGTYAGRVNFGFKDFTFNAEYAHKINDPSVVNNFIYKQGDALYTVLGYSTKGLGVNLSLKRVDNMDYRSDRSETIQTLLINFLPTISRQYTYRLVTLYPYATQTMGEMGGMLELFYTFKPKSLFGGKYGTYLAVNSSYVNNIEQSPDTNGFGYNSDFLGIGKQHFYSDVNVELTKKLSPRIKMTLNYVYIEYNKDVLEGKNIYGIIYSHSGVVDLTYKINNKQSIRTELQHLYTKQDFGSWGMALLEYSYAPQWIVSAFTEYNYGNYDKSKRFFYPNILLTYVKNTNRIAIGYGKQRAGLLCVGGVCRQVPASNGFSLSVSTTF
ncbi:MAG: hypothetical protein IPO27_03780 [Bacteroidetes bacterium]|nr:hypothetical protein [Bacteroidota bacterium]